MGVKQILRRRSKIRLDVGCSDHPQHGFVGLDKRKVRNVDIVHDIERIPWPLPKESCSVVLMSHLWEHLKPWLTIEIANEVWRILEPAGQWWIVTPYAGSYGYYQDPTHCNPANEATFQYFDPDYSLWKVYEPRPWQILRCEYAIVGNLEVIMAKRAASCLKDYYAGKKNGQRTTNRANHS